MIATPESAEKVLADVNGGDMTPTKERTAMNRKMNESQRKEVTCWGLCPQTPGIFRLDANPSTEVPLELNSH